MITIMIMMMIMIITVIVIIIIVIIIIAHNYCVELSNARINQFRDGFFPSTSHLWNSLPSSVFPASFKLPSFKRQVFRHLRDQMA